MVVMLLLSLRLAYMLQQAELRNNKLRLRASRLDARWRSGAKKVLLLQKHIEQLPIQTKTLKTKNKGTKFSYSGANWIPMLSEDISGNEFIIVQGPFCPKCATPLNFKFEHDLNSYEINCPREGCGFSHDLDESPDILRESARKVAIGNHQRVHASKSKTS